MRLLFNLLIIKLALTCRLVVADLQERYLDHLALLKLVLGMALLDLLV